MQLKEYLKKHGITQNQIAKDLGFIPATISFLVTGKRMTTLKNMLMIVAYTNNEVSLSDLIELVPLHPSVMAAREIGRIRRREIEKLREIQQEVDKITQSLKQQAEGPAQSQPA